MWIITHTPLTGWQDDTSSKFSKKGFFTEKHPPRTVAPRGFKTFQPTPTAWALRIRKYTREKSVSDRSVDKSIVGRVSRSKCPCRPSQTKRRMNVDRKESRRRSASTLIDPVHVAAWQVVTADSMHNRMYNVMHNMKCRNPQLWLEKLAEWLYLCAKAFFRA